MPVPKNQTPGDVCLPMLTVLQLLLGLRWFHGKWLWKPYFDVGLRERVLVVAGFEPTFSMMFRKKWASHPMLFPKTDKKTHAAAVCWQKNCEKKNRSGHPRPALPALVLCDTVPAGVPSTCLVSGESNPRKKWLGDIEVGNLWQISWNSRNLLPSNTCICLLCRQHILECWKSLNPAGGCENEQT